MHRTPVRLAALARSRAANAWRRLGWVPERRANASAAGTELTAVAPTHCQRRCTTRAGDDSDVDDLCGVTIFRPNDLLSPADRERRRRTDEFVRVVLTTPHAQEWRDMLSAALRLGTWREHHLQSLLRGVALLVNDRFPDSADRRQPAALKGEEAARRPWRSTPTQRLARVREALIFLTEESRALAALRAADERADSAAAAAVVYRPSEHSVHVMLTMLLRGAEQHHNPHSPPSRSPVSEDLADDATADADGVPHALYRDVWSFAAWMELNGYRVLSFESLAKLETAIDQKEPEAPTRSHALVSRRISRLEYVRQSREWLRERGLGGEEAAVQARHQQRSGSRRVNIPRTEPDD